MDIGNTLVTGAGGFVGSHMVDRLLEEGLSPRATDHPQADCASITEKGVEFIPADLADRHSLKKACSGIDTVFHVASIFDLSASPEDLRRVNVEGVRNLCQAAAHAGARKMVLWSSTAIYGSTPWDRPPADEDTQPDPQTDYGKSKLLQEEAVNSFMSGCEMDVIILRPAPIYGPRNKYGVAKYVFGIAKGRIRAIPGKGDTPFPMVHVRDVVGAAMHLARFDDAAGEAYILIDDSEYNAEQVLQALADMTGAKAPEVHIPMFIASIICRIEELRARVKKQRPRVERDELTFARTVYRFTNAKLKSTGYDLLYPDSLEGLRENVEWYRCQGMIR